MKKIKMFYLFLSSLKKANKIKDYKKMKAKIILMNYKNNVKQNKKEYQNYTKKANVKYKNVFLKNLLIKLKFNKISC